jgi:hypothetical protein
MTSLNKDAQENNHTAMDMCECSDTEFKMSISRNLNGLSENKEKLFSILL